MSRLSVLAIVVTLGTGPGASILCHAWCAGDSRPQGCHETMASVVAADCCDRPTASLAAVFGTESRHGTVSPGLEAGAGQHRLEEPAIATRLIHRHTPHGLHANSLVTVLRI